MQDNVLQKKVQSILTIKEKKRQSSAAQHFMKGARNFLIQYNSQVENIIDIDGIKKEYENEFKDRVSVTIKRAQQSKKDEQTVKGTVMKVAFFAGAATFAIYAVHRKLSSITNNLKNGLFGDIVRYSDQKLTSFEQVNTWVKNMVRFDFTKIMIKLTDRLVFGAIFPCIRLLVDLIDDMFNGNTYEDQNTFEFILNQLAVTAAQRVAEKSTLFNIIEIFGITIHKAVTHRPDLHKFLKLGKEAVQALKEGGATTEQAYKNQGTYTQRKAGLLFYYDQVVTDDFRNRVQDGEGQQVHLGTDSHAGGLQWNAVQTTVSRWNREAVQKYAGAYADAVRTDVLHNVIDPYAEGFRSGFETMLKERMGHEVDMVGTTWDSLFDNLVYTGPQPLKMLDKAHTMLQTNTPLLAKTSPIYNKLMGQYQWLHSQCQGNKTSFKNWAEIHYFHSVVVAFVFGAVEAEALNNSFYNNYMRNRSADAGKSFLQIRAEGLELGMPKLESSYSRALKSIYGGSYDVGQFVSEMTKNGGIFDKWANGQDIFLPLSEENIYKQFKIGKLLTAVRLFTSDKQSYSQLMSIGSVVSENTNVRVVNVDQTSQQGTSITQRISEAGASGQSVVGRTTIGNIANNQTNVDLCIRIHHSYKRLYNVTKSKRKERETVLNSIKEKMKYFLPIVRKKTYQERVQQRSASSGSYDAWSDTQSWMEEQGLVVD